MTRTAIALLLTAAVAAPAFAQATAPAAGPGGGRGPGGAGGPVAPRPTGPIPLTKIVPDGKPHKVETRNKQFLIDNEPTVLIAGEMHFGRILPEDFEARVKQAKAMGLNTISFYLFWNLVEKEEGKFDFTGVNDLRRMFKLCQDNGLWVVLRPGPYCCAEVDYGGIPWWTCKYPDVKIRTNDPKYVEWSRRYIQAVHKEIGDMQASKGGPILMVQMENEFGMVAMGQGGQNHYDYMHTLHGIFKDVGFDVPLFVCDPGSFSGRGGVNPYGEDVLRGRNGLTTPAQYTQTANVIGDFPVFSPEVYTAWFSGWGQPIATRNSTIPSIVNATNVLLDYHASWTYYVFFGGTNWAFYTGCNEWLPLQTSYDYNAPIDEAGRTTEKFRALREVLATRTGRTLPEPPPEPTVATLPAINFTQSFPLLATLPAQPTRTAAKPATMEELDQDYGFVLYRKQFPNGIKGTLDLRSARDYTITMVNGKPVGRSFIGFGPESQSVTLNESGPTTLDLLVHNLGRISVITNAASQDRARKGLVAAPTLDGKELTDGGDWQMFSLPLASGPKAPAGNTATQAAGGPAFYRATFNVTQPASTFLDMRNWGFGAVWVNGHNLGRHWDRGGLRSLFLSQHFLRPGENEIVVLELQDAPKTPTIASSTKIIEEPPIPFPMKLDQRVPAPANQPPGRRGGPPAPGAPATPPAN